MIWRGPHAAWTLLFGTLLLGCGVVPTQAGGGGGGGGSDAGEGGGGDVSAASKQGSIGVILALPGKALVDVAFRAAPTCRASLVAGCQVQQCTEVGATSSAGRLTIADAGTSIVFDPNADGSYPAKTIDWTSGALPVHAAGAEVPAFDVELELPPSIAMTATSPPFMTSSAATAELESQAPLVIWWTPTEGDVAVAFAAAQPTNPSRITCTAKGTAGKIEIPFEVVAAAKTAFAAGSPTTTAALTVSGIDERDVVKDDWGIRVFSEKIGSYRVGEPAIFIVTID